MLFNLRKHTFRQTLLQIRIGMKPDDGSNVGFEAFSTYVKTLYSPRQQVTYYCNCSTWKMMVVHFHILFVESMYLLSIDPSIRVDDPSIPYSSPFYTYSSINLFASSSLHVSINDHKLN